MMRLRRLRDHDSAERAFRIRAYAWTLFFGLGCAVAVYARFGLRAALVPIFIGIAAGWLTLRMAGAGGRIGAWLYHPSGSSMPSQREYSLADTLAARGRFFEAADELQRCAAAYPEDPEPRVRLARLFRDQLQQPEDAVTWFRHTLEVPALTPALEQAVLRELIEVCTHRLRRPRAAAPWLARLAAQHPGSPHGAWAKRELAALKRQMAEEQAPDAR